MFYNPYFYFMPRIPDINNNPPTLYSILNSIANYGKEEKTKIPDLAMATHSDVFNFKYPLSNKVNKEDFETLILNRFLTRRIGFETFTTFQLNLNVKLNMIMPKYNILFDSLIDWDILQDKEITERTGKDNDENNRENITSNSSNTFNENNTNVNTQNTSETETKSDRRFSELPQNQINEIENGNYMTEYNLDTNTSNDNSNGTSISNSVLQGTQKSDTNSNEINTSNKTYEEKITKTSTPSEKFSIYNEMQKNLMNIYEMIFAELNDLFYSIIN